MPTAPPCCRKAGIPPSQMERPAKQWQVPASVGRNSPVKGTAWENDWAQKEGRAMKLGFSCPGTAH